MLLATYAYQIVHIALAKYVHWDTERPYEYIVPDDEADLFVHPNRPGSRNG